MRAVVAGLILAVYVATAAEPVSWSDGRHLRLMISYGEPSSTRVLEINRHPNPENPNGDVEVISWDPRDGSELHRAIFVGSAFIVSRGELPATGRAIDLIDEPLAMSGFVTHLMHEFGDGPDSIYFEEVDEYRPYSPIDIPGVFSRITYDSPSAVSGTVTNGPGGSNRFELRFEAQTEAMPLSIVATWRHELEEASIEDDLSLENWRVYRMIWTHENLGDSILLSDPPATLADLRSLARVEMDSLSSQ